jgi:cell division septum initiation protein DivIVA
VTQLTVPNPQDLQGQVLYDVEGQEVGVIEGVYLDNATRALEWAAVRLGPEALALVPLGEASSASGGVKVDYDLDTVLDAPFQLTALDNEVTEETEQLLYRYYSGDADGGGGESTATSVVGEAPEVLSAAKEEAVDVAATAKDEAADVAATAKDEAAQVVSTAKAEAGEVVATAMEEAAAVVGMAKEETAEVAEVAAAEAREMIDTTRTELESQAEVQLEQIAESLHRLAGQALALARGNPDQAGPLGELVGRAGQELLTVAGGIEERGSAGLLSDAQRVVRQRPRAAILGTAAAIVAGARLMGTPAGDRLKERLAPLKDQAIDAGRSVAEELKPIAQQRAEQVRAVATSAVDQVKQDAQGTVEDVKGTATRSAKTVKGTAKRSATTVKGTAAQSTSSVKRTAKAAATVKRTARAAAPVG